MNRLIREKIFTNFYNKFSPVNHMHYVKCGVNSSFVTYFWQLHMACGTLHHCFITIHSIHKDDDILKIYFCVIFRKTRLHTQAPHHIWYTYTLCPSFVHQKNRECSAGGLNFRWTLFDMATSAKACCCSSSSFFSSSFSSSSSSSPSSSNFAQSCSSSSSTSSSSPPSCSYTSSFPLNAFPQPPIQLFFCLFIFFFSISSFFSSIFFSSSSSFRILCLTADLSIKVM